MNPNRLPNPDFWAGKRVFLTGHTGFKGGWLSLWLHRLGATVCGYALAPPTASNFFSVCKISDLVEHHEADIRDAEALTHSIAAFQPDIVFHLAAQPLVRASYAQPVETFAINFMGTVNVLDAVSHTASVAAAIIVTSDKVYVESANQTGHAETDPLGGRDPYSASKACAEIATAAFPMARTTKIATVRSGNVIGGGDWAEDRLVADFMRAMLAGETLNIRQPQSIRPWQHVLDPLCGYLIAAEFLCAETPASRPSWNFGPAASSEIPVREVAHRLCALWGDAARFELTREPGAPHEAPVLRLNSTKAAQELSWRPGWDLDTALAATVNWFRAFGTGHDMAAFSRVQITQYENQGRA